MSNRIVFGLQKVFFSRAADHQYLGGLAYPTSIAFNDGRQSTPVNTAAGQLTGEFTTGYADSTCTISGVQDATPDLEAIICGRATVAGSNAAIAAPTAKVIDAQVGNWDNVTITPTANTPPGVYLIESTAAAAEKITRLGQLGRVDVGDDIDAVVQNSGIVLAGAGRAALADTGKAIVSVEPQCAAAHRSVGGRPGVSPPKVSMLAITDPTAAADGDDRNAKWLYVPSMSLKTSMQNYTQAEPASMDGEYTVFFDTALNGTHEVGHYEGIVQSVLAGIVLT